MRITLTFLLSLCLAGSATATTLLPADFATTVRESDLIVRGRVSDVRVEMGNGRRTIESVVTLEVADAIKGTTAHTITFRVPGGQIGRYRRVMVGAPSFVRGDEAVLFLRSRPPVVPTVFRLGQGVYRVRPGAGGPVVDWPASERPAMVAAAAQASRLSAVDSARGPIPVDLFVRTVRDEMGRAR